MWLTNTSRSQAFKKIRYLTIQPSLLIERVEVEVHIVLISRLGQGELPASTPVRFILQKNHILSRSSSGVTYKGVFRIGNWIYLLHLKPQQIRVTENFFKLLQQAVTKLHLDSHLNSSGTN
jgi:hypothetical protein